MVMRISSIRYLDRTCIRILAIISAPKTDFAHEQILLSELDEHLFSSKCIIQLLLQVFDLKFGMLQS